MPENDPDPLKGAITENATGETTEEEITLLPMDGEGISPDSDSEETVLSLQLSDSAGQPPREPPVAIGFGDEDEEDRDDDVDDLLHIIGGQFEIDNRPSADDPEGSEPLFTPAHSGEIVSEEPALIGSGVMLGSLHADRSEPIMNALQVASLVALAFGGVAVSASLQGLSPRHVLPWIF